MNKTTKQFQKTNKQTPKKNNVFQLAHVIVYGSVGGAGRAGGNGPCGGVGDASKG